MITGEGKPPPWEIKTEENMKFNEHQISLIEKVLHKLSWTFDDDSKTGKIMWMDKIEVTKEEINAIPQILSRVDEN